MSKLTQLMQPFDATAVQPFGSLNQLPVGTYNVMIDDSEIKQTISGNGYYLRLELRCIEGVNEGKTGNMIINIGSESAKSKEFALSMLSSVCRATNQLMLNDSRQLHGQVMRVEVSLQPNGNGGEKGYTQVSRVISDNSRNIEQPQAQPSAAAQEQPQAQPSTAAWGQPQEEGCPF